MLQRWVWKRSHSRFGYRRSLTAYFGLDRRASVHFGLHRSVRSVAAIGALIGALIIPVATAGTTATADAATVAGGTFPYEECSYTVTASNIIQWAYPGSGSIPGNGGVFISKDATAFSIPYSSSGSIGGQRWIYTINLANNNRGWIGRNYLLLDGCSWWTGGAQPSASPSTKTGGGSGSVVAPPRGERNAVAAAFQFEVCYYTLNASNVGQWLYAGGGGIPGNGGVGTQKGGEFASYPYDSSGVLGGQRWIFGWDYYTGTTGWIGRDYLDLIGCHYDSSK
jgi:hypothetical protein